MDHLKTAYNLGAHAARTEFEKRAVNPALMGNSGIRQQAQNNINRGTMPGPATPRTAPAPAPAPAPRTAPAGRPSFIPPATTNHPTDVGATIKATSGPPI